MFIVNLNQILFFSSSLYNAFEHINMVANDIYTKFYFINVIKRIILPSANDFFPVSHP